MPAEPRRLTTVLLALLGGFSTDAAFPQRSWWPLAMVGTALLVLALRRDSARWSFLVGTAWGVAFFLPHLWWANSAVGPVPWVMLSIAESMIVGLACAVFAWIRRGRPWRGSRLWLAVPFGIVWVAGEQLRQVWPFGGFPWGRLAFSQTDGPLLRLASWGGAPLVSFTVAALGAVLAYGWLALRGADFVRAPLAILVTAACVGGAAVVPLSAVAQDGSVTVGAVQGNVSEPGLGAFNNAFEVLHNHADGTMALLEQQGAGTMDFVVWPENSSDRNPRVDAVARQVVDETVEALGAPLLFGTDRYTDDARYNEMVLWMPGEGPTFAYAKQIPAAFAEYIPLRSIARVFSSAVDLVGVDMARGTQNAVVPVPVERLGRTVDVGTVICFEVAYDALIRDAVVGGAEMLVVPTNNASFGYSSESTQQFAMSRFRAVEHGRTTIQISTVGVSGVIGADGKVTHLTGLFEPAEFAAQIPLRTSLTVSDRLGDWPAIAVTALTGLGLLVGLATGRRRAGA